MKRKIGSGLATLLSREEFSIQVLRRSKGVCVFCSAQAQDPHHVLERKLFEDGGYYLDNGAGVCNAHHWKCETTEISVEQVRVAAGIVLPVLPPGFSGDIRFDKWGNRVWPSGYRSWGPLQQDAGARRALEKGGFLKLMLPPEYSEDDERYEFNGEIFGRYYGENDE
ncbi:hypothetical protein [Undibacterium umbellatum]|uniref:HNH nuclease domain-containing protein n=1 Tax=Undibacterium umbellatum TaxID=2762300 RepID=A0ABR6ZHP6_9BURK|nr:hypothetical protein [Undibacterium umbellatum]MBC3911096.1 hypothetical protein [Undibacterium umbellatum]